MGLLTRAIESRSTIAHPRDPVLAEILGASSATASGAIVTPDTAMREAAVYSCVKVLSESVAQLPLHVYRRRRNGNGKDRADDHPLYDLLHNKPNRRQTSFEFREYLVAVTALRGNCCSRIVSTGGNGVAELMPLEPDRYAIFMAPDGRKALKYWPDNGKEEILLQDEFFHVSGMSLDGGISGLSPISYHRETVGYSLSVKQFGSRLFSNGTHIGTVIEHPKKLSPVAHQNLKESLSNDWGGVINANKAFILEEGMKISKLGMTAEDAQYLDSRKFSRSEIAGIFRIPPHMIGDLDKATFSNIEQQSIDFVTSTLMPWLVRIEQAISRDLISEKDRRRGYFAEFNAMGLLRGDAAARAAYYKSRFEVGSITPNQIRALENENPEEGGDTAFVPLNMIPIDQAGRPDQAVSEAI